MTEAEWEALCDGCAQCCLVKLEDEDSGVIYETDVACKLLDLKTCRCTEYEARSRLVPNCVTLHPGNLGSLPWMPPTCAYRLLHQGEDLLRLRGPVALDRERLHQQHHARSSGQEVRRSDHARLSAGRAGALLWRHRQ